VQSENKNAAAAAIDATVAVDHTAVDAAERDLQGTHILAPVSGRLARPTVQRGDFVQSNAGLPLAVIDHVAPIYVTFPIPGRLLADLRRLQHAHPLDVIAHMANATSVASGHVSAVDSDLDADAMVKVTAIFSNVDRALVPGQFADVVLTLSTEPHALVVPSGAVQSSEQGAFVYVVNDESAVDVRRVQVERVEGDDSIIAAGLKPGDVVVSGGQIHLTPGARVLIHRDESRPHAE
jgi:multidrug efflux system membrane fusion protein